MKVLMNVNKPWGNNYYGYLISVEDDDRTFVPINCDCGGSMYLCEKHALDLFEKCKYNK